MTLPFNKVVVQTALGPQPMTVGQFKALPLAERVRSVLEKRVEFFMDGERVEPRDALNALRSG